MWILSRFVIQIFLPPLRSQQSRFPFETRAPTRTLASEEDKVPGSSQLKGICRQYESALTTGKEGMCSPLLVHLICLTSSQLLLLLPRGVRFDLSFQDSSASIIQLCPSYHCDCHVNTLKIGVLVENACAVKVRSPHRFNGRIMILFQDKTMYERCLTTTQCFLSSLLLCTPQVGFSRWKHRSLIRFSSNSNNSPTSKCPRTLNPLGMSRTKWLTFE